MRKAVVICLLPMLLSLAAQAAETPHSTYPAPPKTSPTPLTRLNPGYQVPLQPEAYVWKVSGNGKANAEEGVVPVYDFVDGHRMMVGTIPIGTEIKLDVFRRIGHLHYYMIPLPPAQGEPKVSASPASAWISGLYLKPFPKQTAAP